jgi:hypothetical protein
VIPSTQLRRPRCNPDGKAALISLPANFRFDQVPTGVREALAPVPTLGPLAAFVGDPGSTTGLAWHGKGFNTIFRPDSPVTPTKLPIRVKHSSFPNVLELNLTLESLVFSAGLGSVPNRGAREADAFLNGMPYLQTVYDVSTGPPVAIHVEPGLWMCMPPTSEEHEQTIVRLASIPHGTTVLAQGTSRTFSGAPKFGQVSITPFVTQPAGARIPPPGKAGQKFPSQTASNGKTARIPQDLSPFIEAGTITQAMLDDPHTLLREQISGLTITFTTAISVSTAPTSPLFGGGAGNIAFLLGSATAETDPQRPVENAQVLQMTATFWIETVEHRLILPLCSAHQPLTLVPEQTHPTLLAPTFTGTPPKAIPKGHVITVESTQIQYSQTMMLNFTGLTWPHVSVATLVPAAPIPLPPSVWH